MEETIAATKFLLGCGRANIKDEGAGYQGLKEQRLGERTQKG